MVSRSWAWQRILGLPRIRSILNSLSEGSCSPPLELAGVLEEADVPPSSAKAPQLISIDSPEELPSILREQNLYVVRLGQHHTGRASFTLCRASRGYRIEALDITLLQAAPELPVEAVQLPSWVSSLALHLGVEALASIAATVLVEALSRGERVYVIPSLRFGHARFTFKPAPSANIYEYRGQVEADALLGRRYIYALEAKAFTRKHSIFKFK